MKEPLFAGLVYNEEGEPVQVAWVGGEPLYAIPDGDFMRHTEAIEVDRQVLSILKSRFLEIKDVIIERVSQMMGSDDPFTRAAIEAGLENLEQILEAPVTNVEDLRLWLWMNKFRVIVDIHGEVVRVEMPGL